MDVQRRERQKKLELGEALRAQMREREGRLQDEEQEDAPWLGLTPREGWEAYEWDAKDRSMLEKYGDAARTASGNSTQVTFSV